MSLKDDMAGAALLADWLGDTGQPVHDMVASFRAERCLEGNNGEPCPLNTAPGWWDKVKGTVAEWIKGELEIKSQMQLRLNGEENLHMCKACGCCLKLKIWTPTIHLKKHIGKDTIAKTPRYCWMRRELDAI